MSMKSMLVSGWVMSGCSGREGEYVERRGSLMC